MRIRIVTFLLASLISMQAQTPQPTDFDGWRSRGIEFMRTNQQQEAANAFEHATNLNPYDPGTHFNLGSAYMLLSFNARSPEHAANAIRARTEFKRVLALDPENPVALAALAAMTYQEAKPLPESEKLSKLQEARDLNKRVILADPTNKQAYLSLGVIAWSEFYPAWMEARASDGLKPLDTGPLRSAASQTKLLSQYGPMIEDGITNLQDAINIDPQYDRAMNIMSLLVSERASLRDTQDQYTRDMTEATGWTLRSLNVSREKSLRPQPAAAGPNSAWFESLALVLAAPPPPPSPPPPPPLPPGSQLPPETRAAAPSTIGIEAIRQAGPLIPASDQPNSLAVITYAGKPQVQILRGDLRVESLAFSPDSKVLATAAGDSARLWDTSTGTLLQTVEIWRPTKSGPAQSLLSPSPFLGFSRDSGTLEAGWSGEPGGLYDVRTGKLLGGFDTPKVPRGSVLSPDGKLMAAGNVAGTVLLNDSHTGELVRVLQGHVGTAYVPAFSSDGKTLACGGIDGSILIWDTETRAVLRNLQNTGRVYDLRISPNGKALAGWTGQDSVELWEVASGSLLQILEAHPGGVGSLDFSPDGTVLATAGTEDSTVKLWRWRKSRPAANSATQTTPPVQTRAENPQPEQPANLKPSSPIPAASQNASLAQLRPPDASEAEPRVAISAGVMVGMLIHKTDPVYPPIAKAQHIAGTVVLQAEISRTGSVESLNVLSGPPMLWQSAIDAVKTWRFRPYLLNSEPVEVETTVSLIFALGG